MNRVNFRIEVVTPLFIAGAYPQRSDLEREGLRPPSIRGALRFWFRAIMGGIAVGAKSYVY